MRKIRDCLRLHFEVGMSQNKIARILQVGRGTIQSYLYRFKKSNLEWSSASALSDTELESALFKYDTLATGTVSREKRPLPDFKYIHKEKKRPGVTLQLLWEEYIVTNPDGLRRSQFCWHYQQWLKNQKGTMRQNHTGGEKVFVDYSGKKPEIIVITTGEIRSVELFVMCWGASDYIYAEAHESQDLENWTMAHVRAFEYFGCVPRLTVIDNLKNGVDKACRYDPDVNKSYQELSEHYCFGVLPARPYAPKDKAKVENGVLIVQRWILARLRNRQFFSLNDLNKAIRELLDECNNKRFQKMPYTRSELFLDIDKPNALPLRTERYEFCEWLHPTISPDYHVSVDNCYYSVPWEYYGKEISVRLLKKSVEIYESNKRIAVHQRLMKPYSFSTENGHLPQKYQKYAWWTLENIMKRASAVGPSTQKLIDKIIKSKTHPLMGYRPAQGILRLENAYGQKRLESACKIALDYGFMRVRQISDILKNGKDTKEKDICETVKNKQNVRGQHYYQQQELFS